MSPLSAAPPTRSSSAPRAPADNETSAVAPEPRDRPAEPGAWRATTAPTAVAAAAPAAAPPTQAGPSSRVTVDPAWLVRAQGSRTAAGRSRPMRSSDQDAAADADGGSERCDGGRPRVSTAPRHGSTRGTRAVAPAAMP